MSGSVDLGPLDILIGVWKGETGRDIAPEPDGTEDNAYYELLEFKVVGDVSNAEEQELGIVQYQQTVRRKTNDKLLHHQIGYWTWDPRTQTVCNSFTIGRRVAVLAGGTATVENGTSIFTVKAEKEHAEWGIIEAAFMRDNASTAAFSQTLRVGSGTLSYKQTTLVDIYGKKGFEHTDENKLFKV